MPWCYSSEYAILYGKKDLADVTKIINQQTLNKETRFTVTRLALSLHAIRQPATLEKEHTLRMSLHGEDEPQSTVTLALKFRTTAKFVSALFGRHLSNDGIENICFS